MVGKVTDDGGVVSLTAQFSSNEIEIELKEDGSFSLNHQDLEQLYGRNLEDGDYSLTLSAKDAAGNISTQTVSFVLDTVGPVVALNLRDDTGSDSTDTVTTDPSLVVSVTDSSQIVSIQAGFGGTPLESFTELTAFVRADGSFSLNREQLEEINSATLADGEYILTLLVEDAAGNVTQEIQSFILDNTAPTASIANSLNTTDTVIEVNYSSAVSQISTENYILIFGEDEISLESVTEIDSTTHQLNLATPLEAGEYRLTIKGVTDIAGNLVEETAALEFTVIGAPVSISPRSGSEMVSLTREVIVNFGKKVDPTTVNENTFTIIAQGEAVPGKIVVSSPQKFATFFPDSPLPASTSVRVTLDGNQVMGLDGVALDADGDGTPGGTLTAHFSTLSITPIEGTELFGYVYDSFNRDENGENIPIVGATIRVDALPEAVAVTDENGYFRLVNLPAPVVAVHIDGTTSTNAPEGFVYPTVGKLLHTVPGQEIQLNHHGEEFDIFLPPMAETDVQQLSPTKNIKVGLGSAGIKQLQQLFPEIDKSTWDLLQVTFPAGSAQDEAGNVAQNAAVIPVNPGRLPAPLPPHFNPKLVISIQAEGATNFDVPAPVTFPNLEGLAPGAKCLLFSFNHDSGSWEVVGTGTVRPDGLAIVSDPGTGILAPGWHFVNEGSPGSPYPKGDDDGCKNKKKVTPDADHRGLQDYFFDGDNQMIELFFKNAAPKCSVPLVVEISYDASVASQFLGGNAFDPENRSLSLAGGDEEILKIKTKNLLGNISSIEKDRLYGVKFKVEGYAEKEPSTKLINEEFYIYRVLDAADADHGDGMVEMADTANDGSGGVVRRRPIEYIMADGAMPTLEVADKTHFSFDSSTKEFIFDPVETKENLDSTVKIFSPNSGTEEVGSLTLLGDGEKLEIFIDRAAFLQSLEDLGREEGIPGATVSESEQQLLDSSNERIEIVNGVISRIGTLLNGFSGGWELVDSPTANAVKVDVFDTRNVRYDNLDPGVIGASGYINSGSNWSDNLDADESLKQLIYNETTSKAERGFLLSEVLNERRSDEVIDIYLDNLFTQVEEELSQQQIIDSVAHTIVHELGHAVGLGHTLLFLNGAPLPLDFEGSGVDIMAPGADLSGEKGFHVTKTALAIALGTNWNQDDANMAIEYYYQYYSTLRTIEAIERMQSGTELRTLGELSVPLDLASGPYLTDEQLERSRQEPPSLLISTFEEGRFSLPRQDWGTVVVDGLGGERTSQKWSLQHGGIVFGGEGDLTITNMKIVSSSNAFQVTPIVPPGTILKNGEELDIIVTFDPTTSGEHQAEIIIENDGQRNRILQLKGFGLSPDGDIRLEVPNNNLGGGQLNQNPITQEDFGTITNIGAAPLTITDILVTEGIGQFAVTGLPGDIDPDNPLIIAPDETYTFDVTFDAHEVGLQGGEIQIVSDDPDNPILVQPLVGTGLLSASPIDYRDIAVDYGNDFVMVGTGSDAYKGDNIFTFRTKSDSEGNWSFFLPPETSFASFIFDPVSGLTNFYSNKSAPSGEPTEIRLHRSGFQPSIEPDSDGDNLPNDIERIIGTSQSNPDTDGDGIDDFQEIELGLDPLSGLAATTGIMASLPLQGSAKAVVVENQTAYLATGTFGLTIVDIGQFNNPIIQGQLDLPGDATDVAVDSNLQTVVVATNGGGLQLIDVSDPMLPSLRATLQIAANQVEIFDGIAYTTEGNSLIAMDLLTGEQLQNITLPGDGTVTGLTRERTNLYGYISGSDTFFIVDVADPTAIKVTGQLHLPTPSSDVGIFAANGVAYLTGGGLHTVDISDPNNPSLISDADLLFTARNVALNGSGLALVAAEDLGLSVYDVTDPSATDALVAGFDTPSLAYDVAIAGGIAYVANGAGGLQIINYLPFDNQGEAPNTEITSPVEDLDPETEGVQRIEGTDIPIISDITDDVQVRNVELLVNGEVVGNDVSFPFELTAVALNQEPEATAVEVQVRATDTGGNTALSNTLTFQLLPEEQGPTIQNILPGDGAVLNSGLEAVTISFDKPLATDTVNPNTFKLLDGEEELVPIKNIQLRNSDRLVQLTFDPLPQSDYQLVILGSLVTDRAGNALSITDVVSEFTLEPRVTFSSYTIPLDDNLQDFVLADVNGDEIVDLVVAGDSKTSILLGAGDGTFPADSLEDIDLEAQLLGLGNFNSDDHLDLFSINGNDRASVFLNDGDGTFSNEEIPVLPEELEINNPSDVVIDDLNSDGVDDVVYGDHDEGVTVLLSLGNGLFTKADQHEFYGLTDIGLADFNKDGDLDVVASNDSKQKLSVFLGSGDGTFATGTEFSVGGYSNSVDVGDVNGDGNLDLITGNTVYSSGSVSLLLGLGNGSFGTPTNYFEDDSVPSAALGDLDGDNDLDLLWTTDPGSASVPTLSWRLNSGSGSFGSTNQFLLGETELEQVELADLDGDGDDDLIALSGGSLFIFRNEI